MTEKTTKELIAEFYAKGGKVTHAKKRKKKELPGSDFANEYSSR